MSDKKPAPILKIFIIVFFLFIIILLGILIVTSKNTNPQNPNVPVSVSEETGLLVNVAVWYPSAPWSEPKSSTDQTPYGNLTGESIQATITSQNPSLEHFEDTNALKSKGFVEDNNLAADGPGSSQWGYKKDKNGKTQVIIFSYNTEPSSTNPNEPIQFNCPCKMNVKVFVSNPFTQTQ